LPPEGDPAGGFLKPAFGVATLRPKRGYSATKHDASSVKRPESLRRQFWEKYDAKKVRNTFVAFFNVGSKETIPSVPSVPFSTMAGRVVVWNCVPCGFGVLQQYTRCSSIRLLRRNTAGMLTVRQQLLESCQLDHQHVMARVSGSRQTSFYSLLFQQQSFGKT